MRRGDVRGEEAEGDGDEEGREGVKRRRTKTEGDKENTAPGR